MQVLLPEEKANLGSCCIGKKLKNPPHVIHNRQGCGLAAKNTEESHHTAGSVKGHAEGENKTEQKKKTPSTTEWIIPWQKMPLCTFYCVKYK